MWKLKRKEDLFGQVLGSSTKGVPKKVQRTKKKKKKKKKRKKKKEKRKKKKKKRLAVPESQCSNYCNSQKVIILEKLKRRWRGPNIQYSNQWN